MNESNKFLLVITGPTASGKSAVALQLAREFNGELINADSVQVYKGFDIGSAKPSIEEMNSVPHHLFSVIEAEEEWNAGIFCVRARSVVSEVIERKKLPIVVGGTGLYIKSLIEGMSDIPEPSFAVKSEIELIINSFKGEGRSKTEISKLIHEMLEKIDPHRAAALHPNDFQRIIRALSIAKSRGQEVSSNSISKASPISFQTLVVVMLPPRESNYLSINDRVYKMLDLGLIKEVETLASCYDLKCKPFGAIGYRHVLEYLSGKYDYEKLVDLIKRDTRRFAKRQLTWWRNQPQVLGWKDDSRICCANSVSWPDSQNESESNKNIKSENVVVSGSIEYLKNLINKISSNSSGIGESESQVSFLRFSLQVD